MFADLRHRLRSVLRRDDVEQQLDDELAFHRERLMERYVAGGLPTDEARRRARLEMGGFDQLQEEHRDARGVRFLEDLDSDLRHAVRQIKRSPGFAATAILCLGVGIGANTAVFSALNSVLLRPLSVAEPARLVMLSRGPSAVLFVSRLPGPQAARAGSLGARSVIPDGVGPRGGRRE